MSEKEDLDSSIHSHHDFKRLASQPLELDSNHEHIKVGFISLPVESTPLQST